MTKKQWKNRIIRQLEHMGSNIEFYDAQIDALAAILDQRDATRQEFEAEGARSVVEGGGAMASRKNPLLVMWDDLNKTALAYWRELGMTPSSYRKITGETPKKEKRQSLAAALASLE